MIVTLSSLSSWGGVRDMRRHTRAHTHAITYAHAHTTTYKHTELTSWHVRRHSFQRQSAYVHANVMRPVKCSDIWGKREMFLSFTPTLSVWSHGAFFYIFTRTGAPAALLALFDKVNTKSHSLTWINIIIICRKCCFWNGQPWCFLNPSCFKKTNA